MSDKTVSRIKTILDNSYTKVLSSQWPIARKNVERLRRVHPDKSPREIVSIINRTYLGAVSTSGASAGALAAVPNGVVQIPATIGDVVAYLEVSVLYVLCLAEVYQLHTEDLERRRLLTTSVLIGGTGASAALDGLTKRTAPYWGKQIVASIPMELVKKANKILGPRFITKWGTKQGILVLGRQVPAFFGAAIGGGGNFLLGKGVIKAGSEILGPPPQSWIESGT